MSLEAKYLYPPNWDGTASDKINPRKFILNLTGQFEEGQQDVQIVDISEMRTVDGEVPDRMVIEKIEWSVSGAGVRLHWDRDPEREIITMTGQGEMSLCRVGGLTDPAPAGDETGDLMLTNYGEYFNVTVTFRLKKD